MATHVLDKPLSGASGYKRLARLVVRAFYSSEVPPREEEPQDDGPSTSRPRFSKHSFDGIAILLIDYLVARSDGYVDETTIASDLRLSSKNIRRALRYLEGEHLVAAESVKLSFKRTGIEVDDAEVEDKFQRRETRVFWCMDYPRLKDAIRLRIHRIKELLRKHAADNDVVRRYICPQCGADYDSLAAISLLDMTTGTFRCEELSCRAELIDHIEVEGGPRGASDITSVKERQAFYKGLQERSEAQLKPIIDQIDKLKDVDPPDYGSLQDWYQTKREEAEKRSKRLEAARKKAADTGGIPQGLTDEQILEWVERAEIQVNLPSADGTSMAVSAAAPGKEVPLWFRNTETQNDDAPSLNISLGTEDQTVGTVGALAEPTKEDIQRQYVEAYIAQVRRQAQEAAAGESPAAKRIKTEHDGVKEEDQGVKLEDAAKQEDDVAWEDADNGNGAAPAAGDDEDMWEDA